MLTACGGGGGGGSKTTGGGTTSSSVTISGLVGSGGTGGASISKAQNAADNPLSNAIINILAYNKSNVLTGSATASTFSTGTFNTDITLSNSGGYLVVNVAKPGFTDYSKRIDFQQPSDINISAILNTVATSIIPVGGDNVTVSSAGNKVVKIALFRDKITGKKSIVTGNSIALRKQAVNPPDLQIEIPTASIPGVTSLKADLNSFDPVTEATSFPGQYLDSNGNSIVSLGFDFINIQTSSGENLGAATVKAIKDGKLAKAAASNTIVTRWIDKTSCATLLKDFCTGVSDNALCNKLTTAEKAAFNVPVYTYNSSKGTWDMLGIGTLDINGDEVIDANDVITDATEPAQTNNGIVNELDYQQQCTNNNGEYLRILVSNEDFLKNWWNLDYPLIFETPKKACIEKTFLVGGKAVEGVWTEVSGDNIRYTYGSSDSTGKVKLEPILVSNSNADRSAQLSYWDPINSEVKTESVTLGETSSCAKKTNTITKQATCQVEGYVKTQAGAAVAGEYLYIYSTSPFYYRATDTNSNGYFKIDAKCNTVQDVYTGLSWQPVKRFNPNSLKTDYPDSEQNDNGTLVTLTDIITENLAPFAFGFLNTDFINTGSSVTAFIYGWDNECDKPLAWTIKNNSTTLKSGTWNACDGYEEQVITFSTANIYPLTLSVTDSNGKTGTYNLGTVNVSDTGGSRPPVIVYASSDNYFPPKSTPITLSGVAYDWDSGSLTWKWYQDGNLIQNQGCSGNANDSYIDTVCTWTTPAVDGTTIPVTFEVSDGNKTSSLSFDVTVGGVPAGLDITIQKKGRK
jgi:hypothetical protein